MAVEQVFIIVLYFVLK